VNPSKTRSLGPLAIGLVTSVSHNQRAGFAGGVLFLAVGLVLLLAVSEPQPPSSTAGH